jgi:hypothetical protein
MAKDVIMREIGRRQARAAAAFRLRSRRLLTGLRGTPALGRRGGGGLLAWRGVLAKLTKPGPFGQF